MTKNSKFYPVIAAIAIQLCLGTAYIWSVFQTGVAKSIFGGDNAAASLTFSILLAILSVGSVIGGKLAAKLSTRTVVITGGIILSIGFFLASFVTADFSWLLWLTYGGLGGLGMGFTYSTTISCAQKWFPEKKGLVTGIIVSALGLGGVLFTPIVESLVRSFGGEGVGESKTFMVLSFIFIVVCTAGGIFMKNPPESTSANASQKSSNNEYTTSEMMKTPAFYLITGTFMLACMGGLMMIAFAKPIAVAKGLAETATVGVLLISMFNSLGRLLWGIISDKLGRKNVIMVLLIGTAILSLFVNLANGYWIYVLIGLIGFFYGGFLSNFPSLTADLFGAKHMAANYGVVLLGFGVGAVISSQIAGYYKNVAANDISLMFPAFMIASGCAIVGIIMMIILRKVPPAKSKVNYTKNI